MIIFYILLVVLLSASILLFLSKKLQYRCSDIDVIIQHNFKNIENINFPTISKAKFYPKAIQIALSAFIIMVLIIAITFLIDYMTYFQYMSEDEKFMSFGLVASFHISMVFMATIFCIVPLFGITMLYSYFIEAILPQLQQQNLIKKYASLLIMKYFKYYIAVPIVFYIILKVLIGYGYFIIAPSLMVTTIVISIIIRLELIRVGLFKVTHLMFDRIFPDRKVITDE